MAAKLTRSGHTLAQAKATLAKGVHPVKLAIPAAVAAGAATLAVTLTDGAGNTKTVKRTVHVGAKA